MEESMFHGASKLIFQKAEMLRKFPTHEEIILWSYLRENQLGLKFRRQHPVSIYIVDFYCHKLKFVIEVDGLIHQNDDVKRNDEERQKRLEALGLKVLRFSNEEIKHNISSVVEKIKEACLI